MTLTFERLPVPAHEMHDKRFWGKSEIQKREYGRMLLSRARLSGLVDGKRCCVCNAPKPEGHHDNYDRPYEVAWLCKLHHRARHSEILLVTPKQPKTAPIRVLAFPGEVSRQLKKLRDRKAEGLCVHCDEPRVTQCYCAKHLLEKREAARATRERLLGRPIRKNRSKYDSVIQVNQQEVA